MLLVTAGNSDMDTLLMAIDDDGDGRVGVDEFIAAFKSLGVEKNLERERKKKKRRRIKEVRKLFLVSTFGKYDHSAKTGSGQT
jgi:Ca2+-binding EF-hand superfamily protein